MYHWAIFLTSSMIKHTVKQFSRAKIHRNAEDLKDHFRST